MIFSHLPAYEDGTEEWFLHTYLPMKMEQTVCSETPAHKIQTPGNYPEENIQHSEQGESLKSRKLYTIAPNICGFSVSDLFRVTLLPSNIWRWRSDFWRVCGSLLMFPTGSLLGSYYGQCYFN